MESGNIRSRWRNFSFFTPAQFFPVPIVLGEKGEGSGETTSCALRGRWERRINKNNLLNEGGAAFMADGYARARQGFGVCIGLGGPGVTNRVTAIASVLTDTD
ncbi:hypothetical protein GQR42_24105 [Microcystis aeruginosa FD4]|uniref:Thiamine pyrophosphate enzyme N-terminal TPP-binding domain-containing protein n=1 Tax=Microcystis aeruginosa FD4 TaxID=2686288 RepID=A0A857DAA6_MICAE|nr:thiamine pyrophosphate-binding protein [Microcystis aeruginosa]QGZ92129.1 hypothetical protein GQR42_24105 [Microcystis aeruginosa FD4]